MFRRTIFMAEMNPSKLAVPLNDRGENFELTIRNDQTVEDLQNAVSTHCKEVKNFKVVTKDATQTLGDLKRKRFQFQVNGKAYDVYPDLRSVIWSDDHFKNKAELAQFAQSNTTLAISKEVVLNEFFDQFVTIAKQ